MTTAKHTLLSVYLPPDLSRYEVMNKLGLQLSKGIEACFYAELDDGRLLFFTEFDVITFVDWSREQIVQALLQLGLYQAEQFESHYLHQDYQLHINPKMSQPFDVNNDRIELPELSLWPVMIVALVIAQSVGLEKFEHQVERHFSKGRHMMETATAGLGWRRRRQFADYAQQISLLRHDILLDLQLLDKPNILWDNETYEQLYIRLAEQLELQERFEIISFKLNTMKEDITMMMELYNHKHSSFLEWIIIVLIGIEIVMGLIEMGAHS